MELYECLNHRLPCEENNGCHMRHHQNHTPRIRIQVKYITIVEIQSYWFPMIRAVFSAGTCRLSPNNDTLSARTTLYIFTQGGVMCYVALQHALSVTQYTQLTHHTHHITTDTGH